MKQEFYAEIKQAGNINGAYIEPPFDVEEVFGAKRVKVRATFDGVEYRGSLVRMGGIYMLGMTQEIRKKLGKNFGDAVFVTLDKDDEERTLELPEEFVTALINHKTAQSNFEGLSYTAKKEYVTWITQAKKAETRVNRIIKAIELLSEGKRLK